MTEGLIDTNIFIHAQTHDRHSAECRAFLRSIAEGKVQVHLEFPVLHELSYSLPRYVKQMGREQGARYLTMVVNWPGIVGDKAMMLATIDRWRDSPGLAFVDAYLCALARERSCPIFTKETRKLRAQGVSVPDPLLQT